MEERENALGSQKCKKLALTPHIAFVNCVALSLCITSLSKNTPVNLKDGIKQQKYFLFIIRSFDHYSGIVRYKGEIEPKIDLLNFLKLPLNHASLIMEYKANLPGIKIKRHLAGKPLSKRQTHTIGRQYKNKRVEDGIQRCHLCDKNPK